ncbi:MAG: hypothetical protein J6N52_01425 [Clostridia bacterium]|nr:hypothetical protein [Clostridia bacterium]
MKKTLLVTLIAVGLLVITAYCLRKTASITAINYIEDMTGDEYHITAVKYDWAQGLFDIAAFSDEKTTKIWCQVSLFKKSKDGHLAVEIMTVNE